MAGPSARRGWRLAIRCQHGDLDRDGARRRQRSRAFESWHEMARGRRHALIRGTHRRPDWPHAMPIHQAAARAEDGLPRRGRGGASPAVASGLERLALRVLLAQDVEELRRAAAAHDLLELGAEVRNQAHALDDDVDDAPGVVLPAQPVIDQHVGAAPAAQDLGLHAPVAAPLVALAHHLDLLVVVALDVAPVGERQVFPEELHELRLLGGGEPAPVPRQHEARHDVEVDVGVGEVLDAVALLLARQALLAEHVDGRLGHLLDDGARALARARHAGEARGARDGGESAMAPAHGFSSRSNSRWYSSSLSSALPSARSRTRARRRCRYALRTKA